MIQGLDRLKVLKTLDLSQNKIKMLQGLQMTESLRFLNVSLNQVDKIMQLQYIENLPQITELDFSFNSIQDRKHYRLQVLYHIPQLRKLDGQDIIVEEKVKAENLHGGDLKDRQLIFETLMPEETFIDRRIARIEDVDEEIMDVNESQTSIQHRTTHSEVARQYVGELIQKVTKEGANYRFF